MASKVCTIPRIIRSSVLVCSLCVLLFLALKIPAHACGLTESCGEMWVALHDVGQDTAFFDRGGQPLRLSDVRAGNRLTANREIDVFAHLADCCESTFSLKQGQSVVVAELRTISISHSCQPEDRSRGARHRKEKFCFDGEQLWMRIQSLNEQIEATNTDELRRRMSLWLSKDQAFRCGAVEPSFPSKNDYPPSANNSTCDDGDSVFFNGLLCTVGEQIGCSTVRRSQSLGAGPNFGRWWRAPTKIGTPENQGGQTSLSTDLALGIIAYIAEKRDREGFRNWINWIHKNPRCVNCVPPGSQRYCEADLCALKPIDCLMLNRLADVLGEPTVCTLLDLLPSIPLPADFDHKFEKLQEDVNAALNKYAHGLPVPPIPDFHSLYQGAAQVYAKSFQALSNLAKNAGIAPLLPAHLAAVMTDINSKVNDNPHLAAVEVFLLEKRLGYESPLLADAAKAILATNPKNPFFIYIAKGRSDPEFAEQILKKCPANKTDSPRFQWAWERAENEMAWTQTMFWDCVFIADLYSTEVPNLPKQPFSNSIDPLIEQAIHDAQAAAKITQDLFEQMQELIKKLEKLPSPDALGCVADASSCEEKFKSCLESPGSCLPSPPNGPPHGKDLPGPVGKICENNWCP